MRRTELTEHRTLSGTNGSADASGTEAQDRHGGLTIALYVWAVGTLWPIAIITMYLMPRDLFGIGALVNSILSPFPTWVAICSGPLSALAAISASAHLDFARSTRILLAIPATLSLIVMSGYILIFCLIFDIFG